MTPRTIVASVNVNGIRAAQRKGMLQWLSDARPDVLLLQEVRAQPQVVVEILGDDWDCRVNDSQIKGRAGVAVAVRRDSGVTMDATFVHDLEPQPDAVDSGRWIEAVLLRDGERAVRVVSAYMHAGEAGTAKQDAKMAHFERVSQRMADLTGDATPTVVAGDFNVARTEADIKNWKANHNKRAGVLDDEIAHLDQWLADGWVDPVRELAGPGPGPYSWWSFRGRAFDNDAGWRIDYHFATQQVGRGAVEYAIYRAQSWDTRFSDHAPVCVTYQF